MKEPRWIEGDPIALGDVPEPPDNYMDESDKSALDFVAEFMEDAAEEIDGLKIEADWVRDRLDHHLKLFVAAAQKLQKVALEIADDGVTEFDEESGRWL